MKNLIFLLAGLGLGVGIGILSTRNHYRKIAYKEINEVREARKRRAESKELAEKNRAMKQAVLDSSEELAKKATEAKERYSGEKYTEPKIHENHESKHYNVFSNDKDEIEEGLFPEDPYELTVDHEAPDDGYSEPFVITEEDFASEKIFYDKVMLEYYTDGIAVNDENDEIIDSIEDLIGPDILSEENLKTLQLKDDTLYVRNDSRSTDYGIIFKDAAFVSEEDLD